MNWEKIAKKYPKAFKKCCKHFELIYDNNEFNSKNYLGGIIYYRELYDFFDKQKIYLDAYQSSKYDCKKIYWYWILESRYFRDTENSTKDGGNFKSRKKAEYVGFKKAFKLLEVKINKQ